MDQCYTPSIRSCCGHASSFVLLLYVLDKICRVFYQPVSMAGWLSYCSTCARVVSSSKVCSRVHLMDAGSWGDPSTFLLVMLSCLSMSGPEQTASLCVGDGHRRLQTELA